MKMTKWIMICLLAVALAPVGCGKKDSQSSGQRQAVRLDVPKLQAAFAAASPELKALSDEAIHNIQYREELLYRAGDPGEACRRSGSHRGTEEGC